MLNLVVIGMLVIGMLALIPYSNKSVLQIINKRTQLPHEGNITLNNKLTVTLRVAYQHTNEGRGIQTKYYGFTVRRAGMLRQTDGMNRSLDRSSKSQR